MRTSQLATGAGLRPSSTNTIPRPQQLRRQLSAARSCSSEPQPSCQQASASISASATAAATQPSMHTACHEGANRRTALALLVSSGMLVNSAVAGANEGPSTSGSGEPKPAVAFPAPPPSAPPAQSSDPSIFNYDFASDLPSNLRVKEYWQTINENRPKVWQQIAAQITAGKYKTLPAWLNSAPAADLRQAALYVPWALLQNNDYNAATDTRKAYRDFDDHVRDLQRVADAVARGEAEPQQVQQAFILMSASLDGFLQTIPAKYIVTPISLPGLPRRTEEPAPAPALPTPQQQ